MDYFGRPWDVPAVEGQRRVKVPRGVPCGWCGVKVRRGDQGFIVPCMRSDPLKGLRMLSEPWHRECQLRSVAGSPDHLCGTCTCRGGDGDRSRMTPEQMRAEAMEVWAMLDQERREQDSFGVCGPSPIERGVPFWALQKGWRGVVAVGEWLAKRTSLR